MLVIHRYWTGEKDPPFEPWLKNALISLNPGVTLHSWTDDNMPSAYEAFINPNQVREQDIPRHRANILRLLFLYDFGGAWYDYDVIPLIPLTSLPRPAIASHNGLCNSFMYFPKNDPRLERAINVIGNAPESDRPSTVVSGSVFLRPFLKKVNLLEYPFGPTGQLLHGNRPFAIHLGLR
jgi:mannosyltransferase OCH1-like enzyme